MRLSDIFEEITLSERRSNPQANTKKSALAEMKKYEGQKDIFVSFTEDVGIRSHEMTKGSVEARGGDASKIKSDHKMSAGIAARGSNQNVRGHKIGINPRSTYDTPIGVYAYPIDYAISKGGRMEFGGNRPYIYVMRAVGKMLDIANYSSEDWQEDADTLMADYGPKAARLMKEAMRDAKTQSPAGWLWNYTRLIAGIVSRQQRENNEPVEPTEPDEDDFDDHESYEDALEEYKLDMQDYHNDLNDYEKELDAYEQSSIADGSPVKWNAILRKLGYAGAMDMSGLGLIHDNEPTQAVFFSKQSFKEVEVIHNRENQDAQTQESIWIRRPDIFVNMLKRGTAPFDEIIKLLKSQVASIIINKTGLTFKDMPADVQQYLKTNYKEMDPFFVAWFVPLSTKQLLEILEKNPNAANVMDLKKKPIMDYILANFSRFSTIMPLTQIPDNYLIDGLNNETVTGESIVRGRKTYSAALLKALCDHAPQTIATIIHNTPGQITEDVAAYFVKTVLNKRGQYERLRYVENLVTDHYRIAIMMFKYMNKPDAAAILKTLGDDRAPLKHQRLSDLNQMTRLFVAARPDMKAYYQP
jgi:hypothetical protein